MARFICIDLDASIAAWNVGAERMFGYESDEVLAQSGAQLIPGENQVTEAAVLEGLRKGERDITNLKEAQDALSKSNAILQAIIRRTTILICVKDRDGKIIMANSAMCRLHGKSESELLGKDDLVFLANSEQARRIRETDLRIMATRCVETVEETVTSRGREWTCLFTKSPCQDAQGEVIGLIGIGVDITERKRVEESLRELVQFNQQIIAGAQEGIIVYDTDLRYKVWNPFMERLTKLSAAEVVGKLAVEVFPFLTETGVAATWARALEGGELETIEFEHRLPQAGQVGWVSHTTGPLRDSHGKIIGIIGLVRDITGPKRAEDELRISEVRYRRFFETTKDGILILDARTGRVADVNPSLVQLLGYSREAFLGKRIWELEFFKHIVRDQGAFEGLLQKEYIRYDDKSLETAEGRRIDVEFVSNIYQVDNQTVVRCNIRDITERKRDEWRALIYKDQLRAFSHRLETLREEERTRISREIHDVLGQMLTGIKMDLRWIEHRLDEFGDDRRVNPILDKLVVATELTDATIRTVQRIATELRPSILDKLGLPTALQDEAVRFEERTGIACTVIVPGDTLALPSEIATAFFRILQEAFTNVTRHAKASCVEVELFVETKGWRLEIRDNGTGMAGVDLTDSKSLGLLGMQERASLLGGGVSFEPRSGGGTVVSIRIPDGGSGGGSA